MLRNLMIGAISAAALTFSTGAFAQQGGTPEEARAMLNKAVAAVKADQLVALATFLKGEAGSWTAIFIHSVHNSRTGRLSSVRRLFQLARTLEPLRTPPATCMVWQTTPQRRSRKVKSPR